MKNIKELIIKALDGALIDFMENPPNEAYEGTSGYFSWYINIKDSKGNQLNQKSGDDFCVNCNISLLEDVVMNGSVDFSEVEEDVRVSFKNYLKVCDEKVLSESAKKADLKNSYFKVAVFEVAHDGADVHRYYWQNHYFSDCLSGKDVSSAKEKALKKVANNGYDLKDVEEEFKNDKEVVMAALNNSGYALQYASDELKDDKEVVLAAVSNANVGHTLEHASDELRADKEVVMAAVQSHGYALEYASDELKADKEVVMAAVQTNGVESRPNDTLDYASDELKADKEVVMAAVQTNGDTLDYASDELKADKEVVMAAVKSKGWALQFATDELKADKEVVLVAIKSDPDAIEYASGSLKNDKEITDLLR